MAPYELAGVSVAFCRIAARASSGNVPSGLRVMLVNASASCNEEKINQ
jgi:hypothetical protein